MNRSSVAIALAGVFAAGALLLACLGLLRPLFLLAAAASGASSYYCWHYGRERILAEAYGDTDPDASDTDRRTRRVSTEDWHRGGFEYRTGDTAPSDDDWDDWRWPGEFWREGERQATDETASRGGHGAREETETGTDGGRWEDPWQEDDPNWWGGWEEETGERTSGGRTTDGRPGGERSNRTTDAGDRTGADERRETGRGHRGTDQRQLSRTREEAAAVLGVAPDASPETIRDAYRERVKETHPDRGGDEAAFRRVRWAYEQLRQ